MGFTAFPVLKIMTMRWIGIELWRWADSIEFLLSWAFLYCLYHSITHSTSPYDNRGRL